MVVFLADRGTLQTRRLHERLKRRLQTDAVFSAARLERAPPRDPGPYRVKADADPAAFLADPTYPAKTARIEVGFDRLTADPHEHYWLNWIEPERNVLVGWHRDDTHPDLGPVHRQILDGDVPVAHEPATVIDAHPLDVFSRRLARLPAVVRAVDWRGGRPRGLDLEAESSERS